MKTKLTLAELRDKGFFVAISYSDLYDVMYITYLQESKADAFSGKYERLWTPLEGEPLMQNPSEQVIWYE